MPDNVHYRPPLKHVKPWMQGPQSATVVGPAGEEIYVDQEGRIKVQFHWDREGKDDENSSCYIRVMQPWAGAGWGTSFIPRIGMEVVVNFFDGDPDRPIISGAVYNGDNKPPFDSKTQSVFGHAPAREVVMPPAMNSVSMTIKAPNKFIFMLKKTSIQRSKMMKR